MSPLAQRGLGAAATLALAAASLAALPTPASAATSIAAGGSAYGSTASVGTLVQSGRTSAASLCTTEAGSTANSTARIDLGLVGRVGAATTKVTSTGTGGTRASTSTSRTAATSLLGGLVSASSITTTATVTRDAKGYRTSGSSVLADLRVAGRAVTAKPGVGTTIAIPGVATVALNQQSAGTSGGLHTKSVTALKVTLLKDNKLGLPTGTVVVGAANVSLNSPTRHRPSGSAYGTQLNAAGVIRSGATAAVGLPCGGSNGTTSTNKLASVNVPGLLTVGGVNTSARSTDTASATTATTTSQVAGASLLGGVVKVKAVTAQANARRAGSAIALSTSGTQVVGLTINGKARTVTAGENSKIAIAGVGTLTLRSTVRSSSGVTVDALRLVLDTRRLGLPAGTVLTVGHANAGVATR